MNQLAANATIKVGNKPMVILPLDQYERMLEDIELSRSRSLPKKIKQARQEYEKNHTFTSSELKKSLNLK